MPYKQVSIITKRWTQVKPPIGSRINWSHPLSRGLVGCWLMNEGGGKIINNIAQNKKENVAVTGTIALNSQGILAQGADAVEKIVLGNVPKLLIQNPVSVITKVFVKSGGQAGYIISSGNNQANQVWTLRITSRIIFQRRDDSTTLVARQTPDNTVSVNNSYTLAATYDATTSGSGIRIFKNGSEQTYVSTTDGYVAPTGVKPIWFGGDRFFHWAGYIYYAYIYNCILSPSEILQLDQEPYCFIQPIIRIFYSIPPSVAAGVTRRRVFLSCN